MSEHNADGGLVAPLSADLSGKVALVTGASKGIGRSIAASYAAAGAKVMLSSRKLEALEAAKALMNGEVEVFPANAGDEDAAKACVEATVERFGSIDILVNNAATNPYYGPTIEVDTGRLDKTLSVNLRAPLLWTQAAWRAGMSEHGGVVVNIASIGGIKGGGNIGVYDVTKAGLIHLTRVLAVELGPKVRVNAICPGLVKTDFAQALVDAHGEHLSASLPTRRLGEPVDIASAALFLASDSSSWMTGQLMVVDGGSLVA